MGNFICFFDLSLRRRGQLPRSCTVKLSSERKMPEDLQGKAKAEEQEDRISQLPECILVHILSFLSLKQSAATSVLSKCWTQLWLYRMCKKLDFDPSQEPMQKREYIRWVNKVLGSCKDGGIDEFRIRFVLNRSSTKHINKWLIFAISKRVSMLDLNLSDESHSPDHPYCFHGGLLDNVHNFEFLTSLSFSGVALTRITLRSVLDKFPFLECLKVCDSKFLSGVEVCGSSLALKHLEITDCFDLRYIIVRDALCLVSLKVINVYDLVIENVPKLVDLCLLGFRWYFTAIIPLLYTCLSRVEVLTLGVSYWNLDWFLEFPAGVLELKQLNLIVEGGSRQRSLMCLISLIRSSPKLEKLVFELQIEMERDLSRGTRKYEKGPGFPLQHLKVIELIGYFDRTLENELLMYLLKNAMALERIIVDPRKQHRTNLLWDEEIARECAKKLEGVIPPYVELIIL